MTKSFSFEAAHRLQNHDGKCKNLHGHSYKVEASVWSSELHQSGPQEGMLLDFRYLSEWWGTVVHALDHLTILQKGDPLVAALRGLTPVIVLDVPPTAENLALELKDSLSNYLIAGPMTDAMFSVDVRVYETANSWAEA